MFNGESVTWAVAGGSFVERLVCHARLPLIAGLDAARPAVHIWQFGPDGVREHGVVEAGPGYPPEVWKRHESVPALAWHPHEPELVVSGAAGLQRWSPDGTRVVAAAPPNAGHRAVAFSPDGQTLWASPASSLDESEAWQHSDALDLRTGAVRVGPRWDTGVVEHPGGGLVVTLSSDQGATDVLFAHPDRDDPAILRMFRHAIVLDVDGYEAPVISDDGRYLAFRGNAYVESLDVFEFPSMRRVLHTTLGEPYPGYPSPPEWIAEQERWSRHNIAFAPRSATLLVGTAEGEILAVDMDSVEVSAREVVAADPVGALAVASTGQVVVADRTGRVAVLDMPSNAERDARPAAQARVAEFLAGTSEIPDGADLEDTLVRHDGQRVWNADDLETVTTAEETDPTWLRLRAAINTHFREHDAR